MDYSFVLHILRSCSQLCNPEVFLSTRSMTLLFWTVSAREEIYVIVSLATGKYPYGFVSMTAPARW